MNEKRELLLLEALKNNGKISVNKANRFYSGNGGKDALISLEAQGYLELDVPGVFKIKKAPDEVINRYKSQKNDGNSSDESDFVKK